MYAIILIAGCLSGEESGALGSEEHEGCGDTSTGAGQDPLALEGTVDCGAKVYAENGCVGCHGVDGEGATAPSLFEHVPCHTDQELIYVMTGNRPDMPDPGLGPQQLADVLVWLRDKYGPYKGADDPTCPEFEP